MKSKLENITCWNCQEENVPTNKFCGKCSANLNPTKEELTMTATDIGVSMQKAMKDETTQNEINAALLKQLQKLQEELQELKNK